MPITLAWYDRLLPYAPYATALIALAALGTAIAAILTQTRVARRRAAIDFFLKTDLDHNMLEAHREFRVAVKELKLHLVDGKTVKSSVELERTIIFSPPGKTVEMNLYRDGEKLSMKVALGERPEQKKEEESGDTSK